MKFRKTFTHFGTLPLLLVPIALVVLFGRRMLPYSQFTLMIFMFAVTIFLSYFLGTLIKVFYFKPRPQPKSYSTIWGKINASSFPSMHTAKAMIILVYILLVAYYVGSLTELSIAMIAFGVGFFFLMARSRAVLRRHFPIDIFAWAVYGLLLSGLIIFYTELMNYFLTLLMGLFQ